jgi:hypothetical protein
MAKVKSKKEGAKSPSPSSGGATTETMAVGERPSGGGGKKGPDKGPKRYVVFEVPHAPMGNSRVSVMVDGTAERFSARDGRIDISRLPAKRRESVAAAFRREGFADVSHTRDTPESRAERQRREEERLRWSNAPKQFTVIHPDTTPSHQIEASVGVQVGEETVKVEFRKGRATVEDKAVADELERQGFRIAQVRERKARQGE